MPDVGAVRVILLGPGRYDWARLDSSGNWERVPTFDPQHGELDALWDSGLFASVANDDETGEAR